MPQIVDISEVLLLLGVSLAPTDEERATALMCITSATGAIKRFLKYDPVYAERTEYYPMLDAGGEYASYWEVNDTVAYEKRISNGSGDLLFVKHIPVRSIVSLKVDYDGRAGTQVGAFAAATAIVEGQDFWPNYDSLDSAGVKVCNDGIIRSLGVWPSQSGSIKIDYFAGYKPAELRGQDEVTVQGGQTIDASPIWDACLDEATRRFHKNWSRRKRLLSGFSGPLAGEKIGDYSYTANQAVLNRLLGAGDLSFESQEKLNSFVNLGWCLAP